jgi:fumarate reductase flavoprotein subunit
MRIGNITPNGGVYIEMKHLGPEKVAKQFKGMVKRCADCGFDLAGDRVEVVPTAHYMMGGIEFEIDCSTEITGLFVAGEDAGGVHGANRLGGNGVANSTVYGGIAGDTMAAFVAGETWREADEAQLQSALNAALRPFARPPGDLHALRENLQTLMWDKVGILRNADDLHKALAELDELTAALENTGLADRERVFNLTWHDWLNLDSLLLVSKAITQAAIAREDSRGAHFREDFPETGDLQTSRFTSVRLENERMQIDNKPVEFTIIRPGESLIGDDAGAPPVTTVSA